MLKVLGPMLPITESDIIDSIENLNHVRKEISVENLTEYNPSLNLSEWIKGIPVIYYPSGLNAVAIRFRNSLQENAKTHAIIEDVIETSHNGIVAWENDSNIQPILLRGQEDSIKTKERYDIFKEYFEKNGIDYKEIFSIKGNILSKIVNLIYILDYASIYLAIKTNVDPSPVSSIDFIKSKL